MESIKSDSQRPSTAGLFSNLGDFAGAWHRLLGGVGCCHGQGANVEGHGAGCETGRAGHEPGPGPANHGRVARG